MNESPSAGIPAHIVWLQRALESGGGQTRLVQTHVSFVLLAGEQVYKFKKPLRFDFVDHTTLEMRRHTCEEEVRLNRRLSPDLYHGVIAIRRLGDAYSLQPESGGEIVDYAVHMKQLPEDFMLDQRIRRGDVTFEMIAGIAGRMAWFHEQGRAEPGIERRTAIGGIETFKENWQANFREVEGIDPTILPPSRLQRIQAFVTTTTQRLTWLLQERQAAGAIVDGHGDLRADAIWIDPGDTTTIDIFDCLEFNEAFRIADSGLDIGFLAMDLEARGRRDLSELLMAIYSQSSGDGTVMPLLPLFKSYRAFVRGKVRSLFAGQPEAGAAVRQMAKDEAQMLFALSESYADAPRIEGLVIVAGLTGSGKSMLAGSLAARTGTTLISTDVVRKQLGGVSPTRSLPESAYSAEATRAVYREVARLTVATLRRNLPVIVDGTFSQRWQRQALAAAATELGAAFRLVECRASDDVIRERQDRRAGTAWTASDATFEVYLRQKSAAEPFEDITPEQHIALDTSTLLSEQVDLVIERMRDRH